ncbi:RNA polymerase sigma factor [Aquimarina sp. BL5]|uniref:RNA polymerase sigma factor n=1 Tax=Aquimarina sp. BL5 TaxID=1714860 RepID=UPI000E4ABF3E|nr:RNA polymerase sigma factor [Aquimarina sp. BL5]AXT54019.1 RNA polymerase sigma factor [Aquimarina sp. BL5]RKN04485.1 sigma-70 family RNA polymerase sigma factor [Aquimarina sp. BL5]
MQITEKDQLKQLVTGDTKLIQDLYRKEFPKIRSFVLANNGDIADAEDVFQKALMQLIARYKVKPFVIESSFSAYFYIVCRNLWRRELNKQKRIVTNDEVMEHSKEAEDMTMATLEQEKWELFQEKLTELSDNCKQLLQLFFQKVPYKDIMEKLGYNTDNVVRQRIFNCKSQLTKLIKSDTRYNQIKEL